MAIFFKENLQNYMSMLKKHSKFAVLKLYINNDIPRCDKLTKLYKEHIELHNKQVLTGDFPNSGFDLFIPNDVKFPTVDPFTTEFVDLNIKCEMLYYDNTDVPKTCPFQLFPRSSMSKTPLMLANHTGIVDAGYRGYLISALRSFSEGYILKQDTRLLQICHPSLCPIYVIMVGEHELSTTMRGSGSFGSTGIIGSIST
jgi:dUTP pyrophosphatase